MTDTELEARLTRLEAEVEAFKRERVLVEPVRKPWWEEIRGTFKDCPKYEEAARLGREWREAQCIEYDGDDNIAAAEEVQHSD